MPVCPGWGSGGWGDGAWGDFCVFSVAGPILGTANAQTVSFELVRSDKDNGQTDALTTTGYSTNSGLIDLNHDRDIKTQANLNVRDPSLLAPYVDFVAV